MRIDIRDNYEIESFYRDMVEDSNSDPEPEEKICKKCLELESECQCAYYDQLEAEELKVIEEDKKHVLINN
jgi:predicted transcriptional regulator